MDPDQLELLQASFALLAPIRAQAAASFYDHLLQTAPDLRAMFPADLTEQGGKLMQMLGVFVSGLGRLEAVVPAMHELGRRHAAYGVVEAHYDVMGDALIWTLERGLGAQFTLAMRAAWTEAYGLIAEAMIAAPRMKAL